MTRLHSDQTFHFELLRAIGAAPYKGADVAEVLAVAGQLQTGDFEGWHRAFVALAERVEGTAAASRDPVSRRDALFRAATYYRSADFFLHGNPDDPRIDDLWRKQRACFDAAIALLPIPGERVTLHAEGFDIPAVFYRASHDVRPTVLVCSGFDGSQEEVLHGVGFGALERDYHVITFEGPGQPTVRREQGVGFIHDWERVVTPVVDYALTQPEVDGRKLTLIGKSMGGYLAPRAAAFEHRLAAVVAIDGVADMFPSFAASLPKELLAMLDDAASRERFDALVARAPKSTDAKQRWAMEQAAWAFATRSAWELMNTARKMTMVGLGERVQCPVLVCDAARDHFFDDQPAALAKILGARATHHVFADDELAAAEHCHVGACVEMNRVTFEWLARVLS